MVTITTALGKLGEEEKTLTMPDIGPILVLL